MPQNPNTPSNFLQVPNLLQQANELEVVLSSGFNNALQVSNGTMPPSFYAIELESGAGLITLEDGGAILLENQS